MTARLGCVLVGAALALGATSATAVAQTKAPGRPQPPVHEPTSEEAPLAGPDQQQPPAGEEGDELRVFAMPGGSLYGGGVIGRPTPSGKNVTVKGGAQLLSVSVAKNRESLNIRGDLLVPCSGGRVYAFPEAHDVKLGADGRFTGSPAHTDRGPGGTQEGTFSFSGRFTGKDYASGKARLAFTVTFSDGSKVDCDTGKLRFVVRDASRRPGVGDARPDRTYYGLTGQGRPIALRTSPKGSALAALALGYSFADGACQSGRGGAILPVSSAPVEISRRRSTVTQRFAFKTGDREVLIRVDLTARFGRARVSGSLRVVQEVRENGARVDQCKTGKLSWQAER